MHDGNILFDGGTFFTRLEIEGEGFGLARDVFVGAFKTLARRHGMDWRVGHTDAPKRMAILVSRYSTNEGGAGSAPDGHRLQVV